MAAAPVPKPAAQKARAKSLPEQWDVRPLAPFWANNEHEMLKVGVRGRGACARTVECSAAGGMRGIVVRASAGFGGSSDSGFPALR